MAAVVTKKWNGDAGVQLTFPYNFQQSYDKPLAYYPSFQGSPFETLIGEDFQSQWHEQKRLDANQSVMNGIQANKTKEKKLLTGPHNYHVPKPLLTQRIYANPSVGAESTSSARRDNSAPLAPYKIVESNPEVSNVVSTTLPATGGLRGGRVQTMEAQQFYRSRLDSRVQELDNINTIAQGYPVPMGQSVVTYNNEKVGPFSKITFFVLLNGLMNTISDGDYNRFSFSDLKDVLLLLFKFGPLATEEDFNNIFEALDIMIMSMTDVSDDPYMDFGIQEGKSTEYPTTILLFLNGMRAYTAEMYKNMYLSEPDKLTLSRSLVKSLGFERLMGSSTPRSLIDKVRLNDARVNQFADNHDDGAADGEFNEPAIAREDEEQSGRQRAPLAGDNGDPNRERFGDKTGAIVYGESSYFGEAQQNDAESQMVAPLSEAGFDPNAQSSQPVNTQALKEAVETEIKIVLSSFKIDSTSSSLSDEELIDKNYADPSMFVNEVVSGLKEKGFNPAQIAAGMSMEGNPVFSEYVTENSGSLNPASITTYRPPAPRVLPPSSAPSTSQPALPEVFIKLKIPATRDGFRAKFDNMDSIRELGSYLDPPYRPHGNTKLKSAQNRIIQMLKDYKPDF